MKRFFKLFGVCCLLMSLLLAGGCGTDAAEKPAASKAFPPFQAKTVTGETVTQEIFAQKKITVVNIWGTFCPPCIKELPELGEWAKSMPDDVQIVGIVCDADGEDDAQTIAEARRILDEAGAHFVNIVPDQAVMKYLENCDAVPTTIFVDSAGKIVGDSVIGADVPRYKAIVEELTK